MLIVVRLVQFYEVNEVGGIGLEMMNHRECSVRNSECDEFMDQRFSSREIMMARECFGPFRVTFKKVLGITYCLLLTKVQLIHNNVW